MCVPITGPSIFNFLDGLSDMVKLRNKGDVIVGEEVVLAGLSVRSSVLPNLNMN